MTAVEQFLGQHKKVGLDTNILIALVEQLASYKRQVAQLLQALDHHQTLLYLSVVSVAELTLKPAQDNRPDVVGQYEIALANGRFLFAPISLSTARLAARITASNRLKVVDGLILASLVEQGATGFVTADRDFRRVSELDILLIEG